MNVKGKWRMQWQHGRAYSRDLRDRVLAAQGSMADVGRRRFGVSASYVSRVRMCRDGQGVCTAKRRGGHVQPRLAVLQEQLLAQVAQAPEQTLAQLCKWAVERGVLVSVVTMHKSLKCWGLSLKKRLALPPGSTEPT